VRGIVQLSALSMWPSGVALWQVFATWPHVTGSEVMVGVVAILVRGREGGLWVLGVVKNPQSFLAGVQSERKMGI
jgi:hypothetical protein